MKRSVIPIIIVALFIGSSAKSQRSKIVAAYNYREMKEYGKAKDAIDTGLKEDKASVLPRGWYYKGLIYQDIHESKDPAVNRLAPDALDVAYKSYLKCIELDLKEKHKSDIKTKMEMCALLFAYRGAKQFNEGEYDVAMVSFEAALEISSRPEFGLVDTSSIYNAAITADKLRKTKEAADYYNKLIELEYGGPNVFALLIRLHRLDSNDTERLAAIEKGRARFPDDNGIIIEQLKYYDDRNDEGKSVEILKVAIEKDPDNVLLYFWLGTMYDKAEDFENGELAYQQALDLAKPEYELKLQEYKNSKGTEMRNASKAALEKIHESYFNILYNFGALYFNRGVAKLKVIDATITDNKKYKIERENAETIMIKALPLLEKALELKPTDRSTMISLKDLYARTEDNVNWERMQQLLEN